MEGEGVDTSKVTPVGGGRVGVEMRVWRVWKSRGGDEGVEGVEE